jgi:hypothetical protein
MSSENVTLLVVGGAALFVNAVLGGPIAAAIAGFFARRSSGAEARHPPKKLPAAHTDAKAEEVPRLV